MRVQNLIMTKEVSTDCNEGLTLQYYLTNNESNETKGNVYGIAIKKLSEKGVESDLVEHISYDKEQVLDLIHTLGDNTVTPMYLINTLDDLMTERFYS